MDVLVSLCNELLLGFKLVRIARGLEHGLALQAISPGLVGGALGEDHMFLLGPLRQAASELVIRQPFDAAEAALVVRAANRSPAAVLFELLFDFALLALPRLDRQSLMAAKTGWEVRAEMQL